MDNRQILTGEIPLERITWKGIAEIVGIVAIVASLVFVALQLKQSQDIAIAEMRASRQSSLVELNNAIGEHAEIWAKGNVGEELSRSEQVIYRSLLNSTHYAYWTSFDRARRFGQDTSLMLAVADFASFLYDNPGARKEWTEFVKSRESRGSILVPPLENIADQFGSAVLQDLAKLDKVEHDR